MGEAVTTYCPVHEGLAILRDGTNDCCRIAALQARVQELGREREAIITVLGCDDCSFTPCDEHAQQLEEGQEALSRAKGE